MKVQIAVICFPKKDLSATKMQLESEYTIIFAAQAVVTNHLPRAALQLPHRFEIQITSMAHTAVIRPKTSKPPIRVYPSLKL